jgi:hypothetical protein
MNLQPWDYWDADGITPKGHGGEVVAALERAIGLASADPAALHLYIHAVEASADPGRAEAAADRLRGLAPGAGHLAHMPAHIGRYGESIEANRAAIAADETFLAAAGDTAGPLHRFGCYPHNVHFPMVSAQMAGLGEDVIASADKLVAITPDGVSQKLAWVQASKTAPYSGHAQFSDPETILALPDPGDRFPFVKGFRHYARGLAHMRAGDAEMAAAEARAIDALIANADMGDPEAQFLPARDVLAIAWNVVDARVLATAGEYDTAVARLEHAAALEDGIGYMEPPLLVLPRAPDPRRRVARGRASWGGGLRVADSRRPAAVIPRNRGDPPSGWRGRRRQYRPGGSNVLADPTGRHCLRRIRGVPRHDERRSRRNSACPRRMPGHHRRRTGATRILSRPKGQAAPKSDMDRLDPAALRAGSAGDPCRTRTRNLLIRSQPLYPVELRGRQCVQAVRRWAEKFSPYPPGRITWRRLCGSKI